MSDGDTGFRRVLSYVAAALIGLGMVGMVVSFRFMSFKDERDIIAGGAGFLAGSILIGSGVVALAILTRREEK
jgi:hypothetical protein